MFIAISAVLAGVLGLWWGLAASARLRRRLAQADEGRAGALARLEERERSLIELRQGLVDREAQLERSRVELAELARKNAVVGTELELERRSGREKLALVEEAQRKLTDAFAGLSSKALQSNNESFLQLAKVSLEKFQEGARGDLDQRQKAIVDLVGPVRESLDKVDLKLQHLEAARSGAYASLTEQVRSLLDTQNLLRAETGNLVKALRAPAVRGRWGEIQLKRVAELAGMIEHCDFTQQETAQSADGARVRPDMIIKMPGGRSVVLDAKVPLQAYLEAIEAPTDAAREGHLRDHARQLRNHILALGRKAYWDQFQPSPQFVVLFVPNEAILSAALEADPSLIELGAAERVIPASPMTLIALLRSVECSWRQEKVAENAQAISALGRDLYKRLGDLARHFGKLGRSLNASVESFNGAVGTLETRVLVSARRFKDLDASLAEPEPLAPIDLAPRQLQAIELLSPPSSSISEDAH